MNWISKIKAKASRRAIVSVLALATTASFGTYEMIKPIGARAATAAPAAAALDPDSVTALTALDHAMETVAARVTPAIVNVAVTSKVKASPVSGNEGDAEQFFQRFFGQGGPQMQQMQPRPQIEHGIGSGILISPDGYIVTNNHVVDGATEIRVTMNDRKTYTAKLIGTDPLTDLAVIKVNGNDFPSVPWGSSTELRPGQTVLAFGNPFGFRFTVTRGIVSGLNRPNPDSSDPRRPGGFIQTDAAINQGNSGGALVDSRGQVIGINTFLISPSGAFSGMGFAIPSQIAKPVVDSLIRTGKVEHAYMGVGISDITPENSKFFEMKSNNGAVITQVESDSPGGKAGLKIGDVVTAVDGQEVTDASQLQIAIGAKKPGTKVELSVLRDGKQINLPVTLELMGSKDGSDSASAESQGKPRWGVGLQDLNSEVRQELQVPSNVQGAVVGNVLPGSAADDAGLRRGDVILQVNRKDVKSAADVKQALSSVPKGQDALVLVWANGGNSFRVLHAPTEQPES
jgi:serine protease Do